MERRDIGKLCTENLALMMFIGVLYKESLGLAARHDQSRSAAIGPRGGDLEDQAARGATSKGSSG